LPSPTSGDARVIGARGYERSSRATQWSVRPDRRPADAAVVPARLAGGACAAVEEPAPAMSPQLAPTDAIATLQLSRRLRRPADAWEACWPCSSAARRCMGGMLAMLVCGPPMHGSHAAHGRLPGADAWEPCCPWSFCRAPMHGSHAARARLHGAMHGSHAAYGRLQRSHACESVHAWEPCCLCSSAGRPCMGRRHATHARLQRSQYSSSAYSATNEIGTRSWTPCRSLVNGRLTSAARPARRRRSPRCCTRTSDRSGTCRSRRSLRSHPRWIRSWRRPPHTCAACTR
jgi:hypothetical protein